MKTFFVLLTLAILGVTTSKCEQRIRRQLWGPPPDLQDFGFQHSPEYHNNDGGFFDGTPDSWMEWMDPSGFDRPLRNPNNFQNSLNDFGNSRGNNRNRDRNRNQNRDRNRNRDRNQNQRQNQNQIPTESSDSLTTTPRTIHYAPQGCTCPMTQQFNPVCGTDGNTYRNEGLLSCYQRCGTRVSKKRLGTC